MTTPIGPGEEAALKRRADTREEFGQFVATTQIYHGAALAYDVDHAVPVGNVEKYAYEKNNMVRRVATAAEAREGRRTEEAEVPPAVVDPPDAVESAPAVRASAKKGS